MIPNMKGKDSAGEMPMGLGHSMQIESRSPENKSNMLLCHQLRQLMKWLH